MMDSDRRGAPRARVIWPATVESVNGRMLLGEVVDVSTSGARLTVRGDLQVGSPVTLHVTVPRIGERLDVVARITRRLGDDLGLDFVGVPEGEARLLESILSGQDRRRRAPRASVNRPVIIEELFGRTSPVILQDLSAFGARVMGERPLTPGGLVSMLMTSMDDHGGIRLRAVVWDGGPTGSVLVFVNLPEADFRRLGAYVERLLEGTGGRVSN
jgi:PilZ domain-containing protein